MTSESKRNFLKGAGLVALGAFAGGPGWDLIKTATGGLVEKLNPEFFPRFQVIVQEKGKGLPENYENFSDIGKKKHNLINNSGSYILITNAIRHQHVFPTICFSNRYGWVGEEMPLSEFELVGDRENGENTFYFVLDSLRGKREFNFTRNFLSDTDLYKSILADAQERVLSSSSRSANVSPFDVYGNREGHDFSGGSPTIATRDAPPKIYGIKLNGVEYEVKGIHNLIGGDRDRLDEEWTQFVKYGNKLIL